MNNFKIIFIGGAPRSGTTLIQRIVATHSEIYGGPEFDLIPEIIKLRNKFKRGVRNGRISKYFLLEEVDDLFSNFIKLAFSYKLKKIENKFYISEKTPSNILVFSDLAEIFPDARLCFVLRDPRAIVASMLQVRDNHIKKWQFPPLFTMGTRSAIEYINECWLAGSQAMQINSNIYPVYYEDVVLNPEDSIGHLASQLGIKFEPSMIDIVEYDMPEFKSNEENWYSKEKLAAPISQDSLSSWSTKLTKYQCYIISKRVLDVDVAARYRYKQDISIALRTFEAISNFLWQTFSPVRRNFLNLAKILYKELRS